MTFHLRVKELPFHNKNVHTRVPPSQRPVAELRSLVHQEEGTCASFVAAPSRVPSGRSSFPREAAHVVGFLLGCRQGILGEPARHKVAANCNGYSSFGSPVCTLNKGLNQSHHVVHSTSNVHDLPWHRYLEKEERSKEISVLSFFHGGWTQNYYIDFHSLPSEGAQL